MIQIPESRERPKQESLYQSLYGYLAPFTPPLIMGITYNQ